MKRAALLVLLFAGSAAAGTVYKSVGPDGVTIYSDRQVPGAVAVDLPESSTYAPRALPTGGEPPPLATEPLSTGEYRSVAIVAPKNEETLYSRDLRVDVEVGIDPALQEGHTLSLALDGNEIAKGLRNTRMRITELERGPHRLEASVYDGEGKLIERSPSIRFYLVTETVIKEQQEAQKEEQQKDEERKKEDDPTKRLDFRAWDKWVKDYKDYEARQGVDYDRIQTRDDYDRLKPPGQILNTAPPRPPVGDPPDPKMLPKDYPKNLIEDTLKLYSDTSTAYKDTHRTQQPFIPDPKKPYESQFTPQKPLTGAPATPTYTPPPTPSYQPAYKTPPPPTYAPPPPSSPPGYTPYFPTTPK